jgi:hypothetical protein
MEKFIHNYLSQTYVLELTSVTKYSVFKFDGDALYKINDVSKFRSFESPNILLSEFKTIFFLTEEELKPIIFSWAKTLKEDVNLDRYWEYIDSLFPVAQHVATTLLGLDLVSVQPMSAPIGELMYLDYQYGVDPIDETMSATTGRRSPINRNVRAYDEETYRQNVLQVAEHYNTTTNIEMTLNDRDNENGVYKAIQKWSNLIGISSRE